MAGNDGGGLDWSDRVDDVMRITLRLHRRLRRVYPRNESGKYDWEDWDSENMALAESEVLRERPELWERYVRKAATSKYYWSVVQRLVLDLAEHSWTKLVIDAAQDSCRPGQRLRFSPLFGWILGVATGKLPAPAKKGPDPGARSWRNLQIFLAVRDLKAVGLSESSAREFVAEEVGLTTVGQICRKLDRVQR